MVVTGHWSYIIWFPYGLYVHTDITVLTHGKDPKLPKWIWPVYQVVCDHIGLTCWSVILIQWAYV